MARYRPKNWKDFQHYKDRSPPWIKLHRGLLDDRAFNALPLASKALAPLLWLLASEDADGEFDGDPQELAFRLRWSVKDVTAGLEPLIRSGFFELVHDASTPLAECLQVATPETERERETERQEKRQREIALAREFEDWWILCPKKVGKQKTKAKFIEIRIKRPELNLTGPMHFYAQSRAGQDEKFTLHPLTWLNQGRWEDELDKAPASNVLAFKLTDEEKAEEEKNLRRLGVIQ